MDLPDDIRDFFTITYERPGRLSPGMVCNVHIVFHPRIKQDITAHLRLLSETGPIDIPLKCTFPKVHPTISVDHMSFPGIVKGDKETLVFRLKNDGALPTRYTIFDAEEELRQRFNVSPISGRKNEKQTAGELLLLVVLVLVVVEVETMASDPVADLKA